MLQKIKYMFNYRRLFKNQKHQNKRLRKKINKLQTSLISELKLDVTNEEIAKLRKQIENQSKQIKKLNLECQKYFDMLMERNNEYED